MLHWCRMDKVNHLTLTRDHKCSKMETIIIINIIIMIMIMMRIIIPNQLILKLKLNTKFKPQFIISPLRPRHRDDRAEKPQLDTENQNHVIIFKREKKLEWTECL